MAPQEGHTFLIHENGRKYLESWGSAVPCSISMNKANDKFDTFIKDSNKI